MDLPASAPAAVWINRAEFCSLYGRTRQWAHTLSLRGDFADFGIPTLRVLHCYGRRARWFYLVPSTLLNRPPASGVK